MQRTVVISEEKKPSCWPQGIVDVINTYSIDVFLKLNHGTLVKEQKLYSQIQIGLRCLHGICH